MKKLELAVILAFFSIPIISLAFVGAPFAGRVSFTTPCTCNLAAGQVSMIITYSALYTVGHVPLSGVSLFYNAPLPSVTFRNFLPGVLSTYELGAYTPGVPAVCFTGAPPACVPANIPVMGIVNMMGTSLPRL